MTKRKVTATQAPPTMTRANASTPKPDMRKSKRQKKQYFTSNDGASSNQENIKKVFNSYREESEPDKIQITGAEKYLKDLKIELDEVAHIALCELLKCPSIGEFNQEDFVAGWREASNSHNQCDTVARQADFMRLIIRPKLEDDAAYAKQVYRYAFKLAKQEAQRSVPQDSALEFWNLFFRSGRGGSDWNSSTTKWLDLWLEFYEEKVGRPVNKDLWNMVGEFMLKTKQEGGESLEWWSEDGAWPMAIDNFVAYVRAKRTSDMDTTS